VWGGRRLATSCWMLASRQGSRDAQRGKGIAAATATAPPPPSPLRRHRRRPKGYLPQGWRRHRRRHHHSTATAPSPRRLPATGAGGIATAAASQPPPLHIVVGYTPRLQRWYRRVATIGTVAVVASDVATAAAANSRWLYVTAAAMATSPRASIVPTTHQLPPAPTQVLFPDREQEVCIAAVCRHLRLDHAPTSACFHPGWIS